MYKTIYKTLHTILPQMSAQWQYDAYGLTIILEIPFSLFRLTLSQKVRILLAVSGMLTDYLH